ncbi:hypothetical protein [Sutcliffiella cohnii]|uniref:hypothetical protein n=1 Tax=Sutcliffiella cohnii TaxID=33932 RepID=UPI0008304C33|nr:hypothetical protein [Sutcliffiella cohnii]
MNNITPLFQLNLYVHMALEYPDKTLINPILFNAGYVIKSIGEELLVPSKIRKEIGEKKVNSKVTPEIIFKNEENSELLLLECKVKSFNGGFEERGTRQALGYLSLNPREVSKFLGLDVPSVPEVKLLYSVEEKSSELLEKTLSNLSDIVKRVDYKPLEYNIHGLEINEDGIYINLKCKSGIKYTKITNDLSPVLYIIPLDPEVNFKDEYGRKVLEEKVRNALRPIIGRNISATTEYSFYLEEVCKKAIPVWDVWSSLSRKKTLRLIKNFIDKVLVELSESGIEHTYNNRCYKIKSKNTKSIEKIRRFLTSKKYNSFNEEFFNFEQLSLFNDEEFDDAGNF